MMPRLECFRGASNCGFINARRCIGAAASDSATGSTAFSEMKLTFDHDNIRPRGQALAFKARGYRSPPWRRRWDGPRSDGCSCSRPTSMENTRLAPLASNTS